MNEEKEATTESSEAFATFEMPLIDYRPTKDTWIADAALSIFCSRDQDQKKENAQKLAVQDAISLAILLEHNGLKPWKDE